jgi:hypothetical protein
VLRWLTWVLVVVPAMAAQGEEDCPWREGTQPPALRIERSRVELRAKYDPYWFRCAKRAGGKLVLRAFSGREGKLRLVRTREQRSYSVYEVLGHRDLCGQDPPEPQAQFVLSGQGAMERLSWKSEVAQVFCPRCQWAPGDHTLALRLPRGRRRPALLVGAVNAGWHRCAREGSTMSIAFFRGATRREALEAREPAFLVEGLQRRHKFKKKIPRKLLCQDDAEWIAFELVGTGEMQAANGLGRHVLRVRCR